MAYKKPPKRTDREKAAYAHWLSHPVDAIKDWFKVTPDDWQADTLNALFGPVDRVAMKAAHGPGKTAIDAWAGHIFLNCYEGCRVVATAPTFAQLHDVLFPEFAKWAGRMPERMQDEWVISGGHIRHKNDPYNWFAVARTSNNPANLQGFHGAHLLLLADEASAIPTNVFEVMEGALSEAGDEGKVAKLLMGGNPNFNSGELHDAFYRNAELYHRVTITGDPDLIGSLGIKQGANHPEHGNIFYSARVKKRYVETIAKKYGREGAVFDVRVRGVFPRHSDDAIFPLEWAQRAALVELPNFDPRLDGFSVIVDPSRGGPAETAIGVARKGILLEIEGHRGMTSTHAISNRVKEVVENWQGRGLKLVEVICDLPGVGGGVIDNLRQIHNLPVRAYDGGKPLVKGVDPDDECLMFQNKRARDHWRVRRKLENGNYPIVNDEAMIAQMATIKYTYNKITEKIQVESKQDMKDRLGPEASPDRSDILVMAGAPHFQEGVTASDIKEGDIFCGVDRETTIYREEMDEGLV